MVNNISAGTAGLSGFCAASAIGLAVRSATVLGRKIDARVALVAAVVFAATSVCTSFAHAHFNTDVDLDAENIKSKFKNNFILGIKYGALLMMIREVAVRFMGGGTKPATEDLGNMGGAALDVAVGSSDAFGPGTEALPPFGGAFPEGRIY